MDGGGLAEATSSLCRRSKYPDNSLGRAGRGLNRLLQGLQVEDSTTKVPKWSEYERVSLSLRATNDEMGRGMSQHPNLPTERPHQVAVGHACV